MPEALAWVHIALRDEYVCVLRLFLLSANQTFLLGCIRVQATWLMKKGPRRDDVMAHAAFTWELSLAVYCSVSVWLTCEALPSLLASTGASHLPHPMFLSFPCQIWLEALLFWAHVYEAITGLVPMTMWRKRKECSNRKITYWLGQISVISQ